VPTNQGIVRPTSTAGVAVDLDTEGVLSDPVDPITGEFVIKEVDLSFPSFGVAYAHRPK
jgi:hypothetical protein